MSTPHEDFTHFSSPYSNDEPKDSVNAVSPLQDVIGFTPDFDKSENMDYSLPHLGDESNNRFAVSRQENFTDFLSPQVTVEPEANNLAVSSRQEHLPNSSLSDSRAKNKDLSVPTGQDNLRLQGFTQPSPRFKQFLTEATHSISSHQPSPSNVIPDSDDQPPKYVSQRIRPIRRRQIPNYPHSTAPLPADIGSEEIITCYPNHLHGQTLLNLLETWTPREIAETCPAKEINKGMISTRVKYARQRLVPDYRPRRRLMAAGVEKAERKTKGKGKVKEAAVEAALKEAEGGATPKDTESGTASVGAARVVAKESGSSGIAQPVNAYRRVNYRDPFEE